MSLACWCQAWKDVDQCDAHCRGLIDFYHLKFIEI